MALVYGVTFIAFIVIGITNFGKKDDFEKMHGRSAFHILGLIAFCILFFAFINAFSRTTQITMWLQIIALPIFGGVFLLYKKQYGIKYAFIVLGYTIVYVVCVFIFVQ